MIHARYYLIRPDDSLIKKLRECQSELRSSFDQIVLWSKKEGDKEKWAVEDSKLLIKLLFLASVSELKDVVGFTELFGAFEISPHFFDKHWHIWPVDEMEDMDFVAQSLSECSFAAIGETGRPLVDAWLRHVRVKE